MIDALSNIEIEKITDIRYLSLQYNEFYKKYYGRQLTPTELYKVEELITNVEKFIRYGEKNYDKTV